jgi:hypothetical protein
MKLSILKKKYVKIIPYTTQNKTKMKLILATLFFLLTVVSVYAQSDLQIVHDQKVLGKNLQNNSDISGVAYVFPERIEHFYIDTLSNLMTVQLRGVTKNEKYLNNSGNVLVYDLVNKNVKWSQKMNYSQDNILQRKDMMIRISRLKSYCINVENGENKWDIQNQINYIDTRQNIGIGYKSTAFAGFNTLEGIDLKTGEALWKKTLNGKYEWNSNFSRIFMWDGAFRLNDSTTVIVIRGLHGINLKTGKGWDYDAVTGTFDYRGYISGLFSNILVDSTSIFMASKTKITRLDYDGKIKWTQPLPVDSTSSSSIFIKDSLLCMVNKGYGISGYSQKFDGKPYLATYDLKTGNQHLLTVIEGKKQQINGFKVNKDAILLVFKNRVSKYSLIDGSLITEKTFVLDSLKELTTFTGGLVYIKADATYKSLESIDSTKNYLWTEAGKLLKLNEKLEVMNEVDVKQIYLCYLKTKDYRFIAKENETIVLDKAGKIVAELQVSANAKLIGSKLYDRQKQNFIEIDVAELMKGQIKQ